MTGSTNRRFARARGGWAIAVAALLLASTTLGQAAAESTKRTTGKRGGLLVPLGPHVGEVVVWETEVELFVYDAEGERVDARRLKGRLNAAPEDKDGKKVAAIAAPLVLRETHLKANADLSEAKLADLRFTVEFPDGTYEGKVRWRRGMDRARLNDQKVLDHEKPSPPSGFPEGLRK